VSSAEPSKNDLERVAQPRIRQSRPSTSFHEFSQTTHESFASAQNGELLLLRSLLGLSLALIHSSTERRPQPTVLVGITAGLGWENVGIWLDLGPQSASAGAPRAFCPLTLPTGCASRRSRPASPLACPSVTRSTSNSTAKQRRGRGWRTIWHPTRRRTDHRAALRPLRPGLYRLPDRLVALCPETAGARRPGHQLRILVRGAADRRHPGRRHRAT
jgi:hypothetical protein